MKLTIQERIQDLRNERGLSLEQLAEQTGLSKSALANYETDESKDISHYALIRLAKFYGVTTDYLLAGQLLSPGDRLALERIVSAIRARADREITLRRADGSVTRLSARELAIACAAVLG